MSKPELYFHLYSPPARTAYLVAKEIGLDFVENKIEIFKGAGKTEDFRQGVSIVGTVPVLKDGENFITDSHAIIIYLVEKFAKDDALYPKDDLMMRTKINEILFYHGCHVHPKTFEAAIQVYRHGREFSGETVVDIYRMYECIDKFLEGNKFMAGNRITLADFCIWSALEILVKFVDTELCPNVTSYLERIREERPEHNKIMVQEVEGHFNYMQACIEKYKK